MAEYAESKAVANTPEAVRISSQEQLRSFQAAANSSTKNNMPYGERVTVDGWQFAENGDVIEVKSGGALLHKSPTRVR